MTTWLDTVLVVLWWLIVFSGSIVALALVAGAVMRAFGGRRP